MRGQMEVKSFELPAYWASALINEDYSGLDASERQQLEAEMVKLAADGWKSVIMDVSQSSDGKVVCFLCREASSRKEPPAITSTEPKDGFLNG